tara:strand:- start:1425 stop:3626 length:2202 start_codon:yes stop_codon:yes gene_type:complete
MIVSGALSASANLTASNVFVPSGNSIFFDAAKTYKITNNGTNLDINGDNIILNANTQVSASANLSASAFYGSNAYVSSLTSSGVVAAGPNGKLTSSAEFTYSDDGIGGGKFLQVRTKGPGANNFTGIMAKTASISVLNAAETGLLVYLGHDGTISASSHITASGHVSASAFYGDGQYLKNVGGGGTPGGSNTNIQFNNAGAFSGSGNFSFLGDKVMMSGSISGSGQLIMSGAQLPFVKLGSNASRSYPTYISSSILSSSADFTLSPAGKIILDGSDVGGVGGINLRNRGSSYAYFRSSSYNGKTAIDIYPEGLLGVTMLTTAGSMGVIHKSFILDPTGSTIDGVSKGLAIVSGSLTASHNISASAFYGSTAYVSSLTSSGIVFADLDGNGQLTSSADFTYNDDGLGGGSFLQVRTKGPAGNNFTGIMAKTASISVLNAAEDGLLAYLGHDGIISGAALTVTHVSASSAITVNTASSAAALSVLGSAAGDQLRVGSGGTYHYKMGRNAGGLLQFKGTQPNFTGYDFQDNSGSPMLRVNTNGNVDVYASLSASANISGSGLYVSNVTLIDGGASFGKSQKPKIALEVHYTGSKAPSVLPNNTGAGEVVYFGTSSASGLQTGALYYLNDQGGWASASAAQTGSSPTSGGGESQLLAISLGSNPSSDGMLIRGFVDAETYFVGNYKTGSAVYVSTSSAKFKSVAPTASNNYVRVIGYATTTPKVIYFNPGSTYVELA